MEPIYIHDLDPILLNLGFLQIRYYGLLFSLAVLNSFYLTQYIYKLNSNRIKNNYPDLIDDAFMYAIIGIIIGLRIGHVTFYNPDYYFSNPVAILKIWEGGVSSHGSYVGFVLGCLLFCYKKKTSFHSIIDIGSIPILLTPVFIRFANFINAEIVGRISDVSWSVAYQPSRYRLPYDIATYYIQKLKQNQTFQDQVLKYHSQSSFQLSQEKLNQAIEYMDMPYLNSLISSLPRHPSQFYEILFCGIVTSLILWMTLKIKNRPDGLLFYLGTGMYFLFRFFIEFFKEYQTLNPGDSYLTMGQYLSIPFIILSIIGIFTIYRKKPLNKTI